MSGDKTEYDVTMVIEKQRVDDDLQLVGGIAYMAQNNGQLLTDSQGHSIPPSVLRAAVHDFMKGDRALGTMHIKAAGGDEVVKTGEVVEAAVLGDGFQPPGWPEGRTALWIVAKVTHPAVWEAVKANKMTGFSIGGKAVMEEVT